LAFLDHVDSGMKIEEAASGMRQLYISCIAANIYIVVAVAGT